ncbi:MAG: hypothetical protein JJ931_12870 [Henriciella sp.]|nr:hypothetical protein [Henriciella sp.]MBO6696300.1 hypothetical protein [Henriciella sp.]
MILRRLPQHVKDQNWIAVVLDFVIVVAGILIAFQISSMAEKRGEVAQFDRQMEALKVEMTENLDRYEIAVDRIRDQYESITALRELLADPESAATEAEINNLFYKSIGVIGIYTKRNSLDVALSSELFVESNAAELIDQIEQWEEKLAQLNRVQQDALNFRDNIMHAHFSETLAYASILGATGIAEGRIAPSRFENSREELSQDRVLDNILAGRQLSTFQDLVYINDLVEQTHEIIASSKSLNARH